MSLSVSVVLPMFNEEAYVARAVCLIVAALEPASGDFEVLIVDDGSSDGTAARAEELAFRDARLSVLRHGRNRGLGAALRTGFSRACKDHILYTDADLPFDFQQVGRALRLLEEQQADMLSAYRFDRSLEGPKRQLYTRTYTLLIQALFRLPVRDINFAFKLFRRSLLDRFVLRSEGSFIDAELLIRARRTGARIIQMGVDYFPRQEGRSTLSSPRVILGIMGELSRLWWTL